MRTKAQNRMIIAMFIVGLFGFCLAGLFFIELPKENADVLKVTLGFLGGSFVTMAAFYFGDSEGKQETLDE